MLAEPRRGDRTDRLSRLQETIRQRLAPAEVPAAIAFAEALYARVGAEDMAELAADGLYGLALAMWRFVQVRSPGQCRVRVYNPRTEEHGWTSSHTVVEMANDDMPFIIDSVTGALTRSGHPVHLLIHPVLRVRRDNGGRWLGLAAPGEADAQAESIVHIEIGEIGDAARRAALEKQLAAVLTDVRAAYQDWQPMLAKLDETLAQFAQAPPPVPGEELEETAAFLAWMRSDHYTFLGVCDYVYAKRGAEATLSAVPGSGLGILRDPARRTLEGPSSDRPMAPVLQEFLSRPELLLVTKTGVRGTVHRPVHMDYVGVKRFDAEGRLCGERRFVGLFTATAYNRSPRDIPLLRRRVAQVIDRAGFDAAGHDGKALLNILETYPRDELFNSDVDTLHDIALGILGLQERPRIRLFVRRDRFERYFSCLVFLPRERLSTQLRTRFERILVEAFNGRPSNYYTQVSDAPLARLHYIIGTDPGAAPAEIDLAAVEARLVEAARDWHDDLATALVERRGEEAGSLAARRFANAFPTSYTEAFSPEVALSDIERMESFAADRVVLCFYRAVEDSDRIVRFKLYNAGEPIALSDTLPMLEHMGFRVLGETPFPVRPADGPVLWIHDYQMLDRAGGEIDLPALKAKLEATFAGVRLGEIENDGFNRLVLATGLSPEEAMWLRAYGRYLRQVGIAFSQDYMAETLARHPGVARSLVELFRLRFDPAFDGDRAAAQADAVARVEGCLEAVQSLDEDRILRRFLNLVQATVRTNRYRREADGRPPATFAVKLVSGEVTELPLPRPWREIFVYSPRVEAIHLRGGPVARGGLRWSDRREDFRTEVLGLMKAQQSKNAVIVPVGSKGGFVPKRLPAGGEREAVQAEGIACYRLFIGAMLEITDNLQGGRVAAPTDVVRHDEDDPYLVVGADKGTATFSDIANEIAVQCGFWLGDAFASGGATGYDHKKMAITSRGAWEAVRRHFRELGRDVDAEPFTCIGIGDMSGDVFGNGLLRSRSGRLLAAFDHRDVFVDPDPDPEASYRERERLFALPRSSWEDYDRTLISAGGGVFSRRAKAVPLSPEIRALTGLSGERATPAELIKALLKAEVDLLFNGGIGTFVKAREETHEDAGDRANDAIRIDGAELRCKVVGEGGNLGFTQRGRIEAAFAGVRLNTDAIDNSAGVDCSDHEVNIKILLGAVVGEGELTEKQRNRLLAEMTDEVAELVLRDNYLQTQALSLAESAAAASFEDDVRFMRRLERLGQLDRTVEFLPDDEEIARRRSAGVGLTRPEFAVLLAYAKMELFGALLSGDLVDSRYLEIDVVKYFPRPLRKRFLKHIQQHRLRREIIATATANSLINRMGISFVDRLAEDAGADANLVARAYALMRDAYAMRPLWNGIEALDNKVPATVQIAMFRETTALLERTTDWALGALPQPVRIQPALAVLQPGIAQLAAELESVVGPLEREALARRVEDYAGQGVPAELARPVAALGLMAAAPDIVQVADELGRPVAEVGGVHFGLAARLGLDWLADAAARHAPADRWERLARTAILEEIAGRQRELVAAVLREGSETSPAGMVDAWAARRAEPIGRFAGLLDDFRTGGQVDLARLALAGRALRRVGAA